MRPTSILYNTRPYGKIHACFLIEQLESFMLHYFFMHKLCLSHVFAKIGKRVYAFFMKLAHKNGNMMRNMSKPSLAPPLR